MYLFIFLYIRCILVYLQIQQDQIILRGEKNSKEVYELVKQYTKTFLVIDYTYVRKKYHVQTQQISISVTFQETNR